MCYSGLCSFEAGGGNAGECTAPLGFEKRYGVSPCMVGGGYGEPDDVQWAKDHAGEIEKAREAYWEDYRKRQEETKMRYGGHRLKCSNCGAKIEGGQS